MLGMLPKNKNTHYVVRMRHIRHKIANQKTSHFKTVSAINSDANVTRHEPQNFTEE